MQKTIQNRRYQANKVLAVLVLISGLALPGYSPGPHLASSSVLAREGQPAVWRQLVNPAFTDVHTLAIDPANPANIYVGTSGRVVRSSDGGENWERPSGWLGEQVVALTIDFANPKILYAGTSWSSYCHHSERRIFKSIDGGETFSVISPEINGCDRINALVMSPADRRTIYVANFDGLGDSFSPLIKTLDGGESWIALFNPPFAVLAIDPANPDNLYGGTLGLEYFGWDGWDYRNGVLRSTDGGVNWSPTELSKTAISALTIDPLNPGILYAAGTLREHDPKGFRGLFKSQDSGTTWYEINKGLAHLIHTTSSISDLVIHPGKSNILYAGTSGHGVFKSIDGGASWIAFNEGLTNLDIRTLAMAKSSPGSLLVATAGGVFKIVDSDQPSSGTLVTASAASYDLTGLASEAIAASFGTGLAIASKGASVVPLPTVLAGTTVKVKDSDGTERLAPLFFVSPTQVNYQIPPGTVAGVASVTITNGDGGVSSGTILVKTVAPGLFGANQGGQGVAAGMVLRVRADGLQSYEDIAQFDAVHNQFVPRPIDLGPESDQVFLILFGTGIRFRSSLSAVTVTIGGANTGASFAGAQPEFVGLDQVNVSLLRHFSGRGELDVSILVDSQVANTLRISIR